MKNTSIAKTTYRYTYKIDLLLQNSVLVNFAKGEDAYDPINPQAVVFPNSNEELSTSS